MSDKQFKDVTQSFGSGAADSSIEAFRQLEKAEALRVRGELDRARTLCEPLVARYPDYYGALYTLGLIYGDKGHAPQALGCLVRAVMLDPRSWRALTALSAVYLELGAHEMAAQSLEQARRINPREASIFATLGEIYRAEREYELAYDAYREALTLDGDLELAGTGLGASCLYLGRYVEAGKIFSELAKKDDYSLLTLSALASLPSAMSEVDVLSKLEKVKPAKSEDAKYFANSLANVRASALDALGRHQEAWDEMVAANQAFQADKQDALRQLKQVERRILESARKGKIKVQADHAQTISLFILGPSRSGKTTMESLVAALEGVKRGYENPIVENAIRRAFQSAGMINGELFDVLPPTLDASCREIYLEELGRRAGVAKVFTNTHPVRIHDATRMAAVFPGTRFIFVKRDIDDNMLRIFMRQYALANPYAYDLKAIREHLAWYHEMIDTLAEKLPTITRVIRYEDIIAEPAAAVKMAAELCDLDPKAGLLPELGDDRGCAGPYRQLMKAVLDS